MKVASAILTALLLPLTAAAEESADPPAPAAAQSNVAAQEPAPAAPPAPAKAPQPEPQRPEPPRTTVQSICLMIEAAAAANRLPVDYFVRVIWRESNFRTDAVGPPTRSGARAQGIAQFMPGTAEERRLLDPFDPVQALPKAAEFLRELHAEFGNLGLAAAAYNAGPGRVREWLAGRSALPAETQRYVEAVTGQPAEYWMAGKAVSSGMPAHQHLGCTEMIALLRRGPNQFVEGLQRHVATAASKPWGVQVSAGFARDRALATYSEIERSHRALLQGFDLVILQNVLYTRGTRPFYQVRLGADTRDSAEKLCLRLRAVRVACIVLRNHTRGPTVARPPAGTRATTSSAGNRF